MSTDESQFEKDFGEGVERYNEHDGRAQAFAFGAAYARKRVIARIRELITDNQSDAAIRHALLIELEDE